MRKDDGERVGKISGGASGTSYEWSVKSRNSESCEDGSRRFPARFAYPTSERVSRARSGETLEQCVLRSLDQYFADLDGSRPHALLDMVTTAVERPLLQFAMNRCDGNQCAAAELLGINRNTLRKKLQQYRLL